MAKQTLARLDHGRILLIIGKKLATETPPRGWISRDYAERGEKKKNQSQRLRALRFHLYNILSTRISWKWRTGERLAGLGGGGGGEERVWLGRCSEEGLYSERTVLPLDGGGGYINLHMS